MFKGCHKILCSTGFFFGRDMDTGSSTLEWPKSKKDCSQRKILIGAVFSVFINKPTASNYLMSLNLLINLNTKDYL